MIFLLLLTIHLVPTVPHISSEADLIIETLLAAPCLEEFWQKDGAGHIQLAGIWGNNALPGQGKIHSPTGQIVPIWPGKQKVLADHLVIDQFRLKGGRARIKLSGYHNMRVKASLRIEDGQWEINRISVQQKVQKANGSTGKRYCMDF